jgi:hypothetical protein
MLTGTRTAPRRLSQSPEAPCRVLPRRPTARGPWLAGSLRTTRGALIPEPGDKWLRCGDATHQEQHLITQQHVWQRGLHDATSTAGVWNQPLHHLMANARTGPPPMSLAIQMSRMRCLTHAFEKRRLKNEDSLCLPLVWLTLRPWS